MKMSNIANQLVAVAATLAGFAAHDTLTSRHGSQQIVVGVAPNETSRTVTRAIDLSTIAADWPTGSPRAEPVAQLRPALHRPSRTPSTRPQRNMPAIEIGAHVRAAPDLRSIDAASLR
jgi:hypothetical protein